MQASVVNLGLPDRLIEHGTRDQMLQEAGLDRSGIAAAIKRCFSLYRSHRSAVA